MLGFCFFYYNHRVHIDWQWQLSGVYSIMMVNAAQPVEGGAHPPPFTLSAITNTAVMYASAERADTLLLFLLYPFLLCGYNNPIS
jgi:hypothetical protein